MKVKELFESKPEYTIKHGTRKFRVSSKADVPFKDLDLPEDVVKKYIGPNTKMIDVTRDERVQKASGENKWRMMRLIFQGSQDTIVFAKVSDTEWFGLAINVEV
jgi:hypothetical protein